ncbi:MAG TPA: hypothetical protein VH914_18860 [Acidimicrobiia bacterium]|jgi:hypothetical protein|nr:hypothetical protein [Acidimicrobiia bacterium]
MDLDARKMALILGRSRAVVGLVLLVLPGLAGRLWLGDHSPRTRALLRMVGIRDLILGAGALTCVKERTQDAEWVGMGSIADAVDGFVSLTSPGVPARGRLVGPAALGSAVLGLKLARDLADERTARATES